MSYISVNNASAYSVAQRAVADEPWFQRIPATERKRVYLDIAAEIADAVNGKINHYRENLGAFDVDPAPHANQAERS